MITLNKVFHSYNINFVNMMILMSYIFSILVWKDLKKNLWTKVLETLKFFRKYLHITQRFMFIFFNFRGMCNFRRNNEKTSHTVKMET